LFRKFTLNFRKVEIVAVVIGCVLHVEPGGGMDIMCMFTQGILSRTLPTWLLHMYELNQYDEEQ